MGAATRILILGGAHAAEEAIPHALQSAGLDSVFFYASTETDYVRLLKVGLDVVLADPSQDLGPGRLTTPAALSLLHDQQLDVAFIVVTESIGEEAVVDYMRRGATDVIFRDRLA